MHASPAVHLPADAATVLSRCLWQWLALGALLSILLPAMSSHWIGPPWFWGVAAPAVSLLVFHRDALVAAWRARGMAVGYRAKQGAPAKATWRAPVRSVKVRRSRSPGHRPRSPLRAA